MYKNVETIINDDVTSTDDTENIVEDFKKQGMRVLYVQENTSMAQGRKRGSSYANGEILLHLDSDMRLEPEVVMECVSLIERGADALVIPEESFGIGFWAQCKWLEKKCYEGVAQIESLRCLKASVYSAVGGHNPKLVFSEDKDLDIRVKKAGYTVERTKSKIFHNEGNLSLQGTLSKKFSYVNTADQFAALHPQEFAWQINIFNRFYLYLKNVNYFFKYPHLYLGMLFMKTSEFVVGLLGFIKGKISV